MNRLLENAYNLGLQMMLGLALAWPSAPCQAQQPAAAQTTPAARPNLLTQIDAADYQLIRPYLSWLLKELSPSLAKIKKKNKENLEVLVRSTFPVPIGERILSGEAVKIYHPSLDQYRVRLRFENRDIGRDLTLRFEQAEPNSNKFSIYVSSPEFGLSASSETKIRFVAELWQDGSEILLTRLNFATMSQCPFLSKYAFCEQRIYNVDLEQKTVHRFDFDADEPRSDLMSLNSVQTQQDQGIRVGVLDMNFDYTNPELAKLLIPSLSTSQEPHPFLAFSGNKALREIRSYSVFEYETLKIALHGTHVSGIVAAKGEVVIIPLYWPENLTEAIDYAKSHGARVINISLGSDFVHFAQLDQAMKLNPDMMFVVGAGNQGREIKTVSQINPAGFFNENQITVAAVDSANRLQPWSNYSQRFVHLAADGVDVESLFTINSTARKSGTSMSAPQVTRTVARMLAIDPTLTPQQIKSILQQTVTTTPELKQKTIFGGALNEEAALEYVRSRKAANRRHM